MKGPNYYVFHGRVALFFANEIFIQHFLDPEVILSLHSMFINAPTKEFTLTHLVTFSISSSHVQMKFYFVYS